MAVLRVRKVDPGTIRWLERRAERNGRSLEDEVCAILWDAVKDEEDEPETKAGGKRRGKNTGK